MKSSRAILVTCLSLGAAGATTWPGEGPAEGTIDRVVRSQAIRFLTEPIPQFPSRRWRGAGGLRLGRREGEAPGELSFLGLAADDELTPGAGIAPSAIVSLIRKNIAPDTWTHPGNTIRVESGEPLWNSPQLRCSLAHALAGGSGLPGPRSGIPEGQLESQRTSSRSCALGVIRGSFRQLEGNVPPAITPSRSTRLDLSGSGLEWHL